MTQRLIMAEVWMDHGKDPLKAILAYAKKEDSGLVLRKSNKHSLSAENYAKRLLCDGLRKGWLK